MPPTLEKMVRGKSFKDGLREIQGWLPEAQRDLLRLAASSRSLQEAFSDHTYAPWGPCYRVMLVIPDMGTTWRIDIVSDCPEKYAMSRPLSFDKEEDLPQRSIVDRTCNPYPSTEALLIALFQLSKAAMHQMKEQNAEISGMHKLSLTMGQYIQNLSICYMQSMHASGENQPVTNIITPIPTTFQKQGLEGICILFESRQENVFAAADPLVDYDIMDQLVIWDTTSISIKLESMPEILYVQMTFDGTHAHISSNIDPEHVKIVKQWLLTLFASPSACPWLLHGRLLTSSGAPVSHCPASLRASCFSVAPPIWMPDIFSYDDIHFGKQIYLWVTHVIEDETEVEDL